MASLGSAAGRLTKRRDFVAARNGVRAHSDCLSVQALRRSTSDVGGPRVGFTVTKKIGNAVARNRIKRRLRDVVRRLPPHLLDPAFDYVLIAKRGALDTPFTDLTAETARALKRAHERARPSRKGGAPRHDAGVARS